MLLVAVLVLTNTVSADGSISGLYNKSLQLAEQAGGKSNVEVNQLTDDLKQLVEPKEQKPAPSPPKEEDNQSKEQNKAGAKPADSNKR